MDVDSLARAALDAPPTKPTPRTHMVKERVKEEKTYQDARGYLVCEEVWVEREVERELPDWPSAGGSSKPKPTLKAQMPSAKPKAKGPRGMETVDAAELQEQKDAKDAKKAAKEGKAPPKASTAKVVTGAGSILGFFGKK